MIIGFCGKMVFISSKKERLTPMVGPLDEEHWELFAQARAAGKTVIEASESAGFTPTTGYRIEKNDEVIDRIDQIKLERRDITNLTYEEQIRKWNELYHFAMKKGELKVAKDCLAMLDDLGGWGLTSKKDSGSGKKGLSKPGDTVNAVIFTGDNPNDTEQLSGAMLKLQNILNSGTSRQQPIKDITPREDT